MNTNKIKRSAPVRQSLEIEIRDCYTASVQSALDDGATNTAAHESAWRNTIDTFPRISTGDLAAIVDGCL